MRNDKTGRTQVELATNKTILFSFNWLWLARLSSGRKREDEAWINLSIKALPLIIRTLIRRQREWSVLYPFIIPSTKLQSFLSQIRNFFIFGVDCWQGVNIWDYQQDPVNSHSHSMDFLIKIEQHGTLHSDDSEIGWCGALSSNRALRGSARGDKKRALRVNEWEP